MAKRVMSLHSDQFQTELWLYICTVNTDVYKM